MKRDIHKYSEIGGRDRNEDCVDYREYGENLVAVVADGLGGQGDGDIASRTVCESLIRCGEDGKLPDKGSVKAAFEKANRELMAKQKNAFHMKTTAVYLSLCQNRAIWAHIGDSRLYHIKDGKLVDYTLDHSASQMAVFMGQITREEIPTDPGQHMLLRAMGVAEETPDIHEPIVLEKGKHVFLLCSDGLWEYLTDGEIELAAAKYATVQQFLAGLTALKLTRSPNDCDNSSAVAVFVEV